MAAVYSRCADTGTLQDCHLAELPLGAAGATERMLAPPGGGSVHEPAIWNSRIVFLRRNAVGGSEDPLIPAANPTAFLPGISAAAS